MSISNRRSFLRSSLAGGAVLLLAACGAPASPTAAPAATPPPKPADTPKPAPTAAVAAPKDAPKPAATAAPAAKPSQTFNLKIALATEAQSSFGYVVAEELGYFRDEGLNASLELPPPLVGVQGVIAGEYHATTAGAAAGLSAVQGQPIKILLNTQETVTFWLMANPQSGVQQIADLKGKKIAIEGPKSVSDTLMRAILKKNGLDPDADVTYLGAGAPPNWIQQVIAGNVDAGFASDVEPMILARRQGMVPLAYAGDELRTTLNGLGVMEKTLTEQPELAKRMVRATVKGLRHYRAKKAEVVAIAVRRVKVDESVASEGYDIMRQYTLDDPVISEDRQREFISLGREMLGVDRPIEPGEIYKYDLVRQAIQELDAEGWKPK